MDALPKGATGTGGIDEGHCRAVRTHGQGGPRVPAAPGGKLRRVVGHPSLLVVWISSGVRSLAAFHAGERRRYSFTSSSAVLPRWCGAENWSRYSCPL